MLDLFFYVFLVVFILAAFSVILSKNTMHSVLYLILVFFLSSLLLFIVGAEFLAIILLIVYVGAISILFIFVVMLLNLRVVELYSTFLHYLPIGAFVGFYFFFEFFLLLFNDFKVTTGSFVFDDSVALGLLQPLVASNLELFGFMLYNYCNLFVIMMSVVLLISMMGVIIITSGLDKRSAKESFLHDLESFSKNLNITIWKLY